ncbi:hypothetical protein DFH28DRAFT_934036 [Melampsora americana]|nr:hypothetical protein DFH28DRAFT_934036 [Melampsora americana]
MAKSLNIAAILKQNLELQQKQIEAQNKVIEQMQAQSAAREQQYEDLLKKFETVGVNGPQSQSSPPAPKKKARASTGSIPNKTSTPSKSAKCSSRKKVPATPAPKTPVNPSRASGSKSATSRVKASSSKKPSPRKHPDQLTHEDWPEGYEQTKNCFFTFIRIIWGLILSSAVPKAPDPAMVAEFNAHFSDVSDLKVSWYLTYHVFLLTMSLVVARIRLVAVFTHLNLITPDNNLDAIDNPTDTESTDSPDDNSSTSTVRRSSGLRTLALPSRLLSSSMSTEQSVRSTHVGRSYGFYIMALDSWGYTFSLPSPVSESPHSSESLSLDFPAPALLTPLRAFRWTFRNQL